jgi:hypothetical protein
MVSAEFMRDCMNVIAFTGNSCPRSAAERKLYAVAQCVLHAEKNFSGLTFNESISREKIETQPQYLSGANFFSC